MADFAKHNVPRRICEPRLDLETYPNAYVNKGAGELAFREEERGGPTAFFDTKNSKSTVGALFGLPFAKGDDS